MVWNWLSADGANDNEMIHSTLQNRPHHDLADQIIGGDDEALRPAVMRELAVILDDMDAGVDADACYQREAGFSYNEIAAWGAR